MDKLKDMIRELREKNNHTRGDLAKRLKISESALGKYERGERSIKPDLLEKIANIYDVPVSYFFVDEQEPPRTNADETLHQAAEELIKMFAKKQSFTEAEENVIQEKNLTPESLKGKYNFVVDGKPATNEEIEEMVKYVKAYRIMKGMESSS